jgi:hypothetical protein
MKEIKGLLTIKLYKNLPHKIHLHSVHGKR